MHPKELVDEARRLYATGLTAADVARLMGLPWGTVAHWCRGDRRPTRAVRSPASCPRCTEAPLDDERYAYLLGQYLGDGHITTSSASVHCLSISCADVWPGVRAEVEAALVCRPARVQGLLRPAHRLHDVKSYSIHWTCLFPQHGPGQEARADDSARAMAAGNRRRPPRRVSARAHPLRRLPHDELDHNAASPGELKRYEYPRYFFSNKSLDILALCCAALDRLGIAHRRPRWDQVSVARREAVAALDVWVGPKT